MYSFAASPFLDALGWALLNSLWQFGVLWLLYGVLTAGIKKLTASAKHAIAVYLIMAGTLWFAISLSWKYYSAPSVNDAVENSFAIENTTYYHLYYATHQFMDKLMPYWSVAYLLCIVVLFIKFRFFIQNANDLRTKNISKLPVNWRMYVRKISRQLGIEKEVHAVLSSGIDTPQVIGFLKPVILVPLACLSHLTTEQLEAVLLHELVHIKRNDYLMNLFVATIEILFFFNPFVRQLVARIRKEREYGCDDMVIQFQYHPHNYATALLTLEKNRKMPVTYGIAASGTSQKQLLVRIQRLVGIKPNRQRFFQAGAYLFALLLLGFIAMVNPVKIVIDKLQPVPNVFAVNYKPAQYSKESGSIFTTAKTKDQTPKLAIIKPKKPLHTAAAGSEDADNDAPAEETVLLGELAPVQTIQATTTETVDFSLPENSVAAVPAPEEAATLPYVPHNSFSYHYVPDTSSPTQKRETYQERMAKETLAKTNKALEQIDWQKIQKQLKYNKAQLASLKIALTKQLKALNWQEINKAVQDQSNAEQFESVREALRQQEAIKQYQQHEAYYETLQRQVTERQQLIRENDKRLQNQQKTIQDQEMKVQEEMKKRRIIYI